MRLRSSALVTAVSALLSVVLVAGCEARVHGDTLGTRDPGPPAMAPPAIEEPPAALPPAALPVAALPVAALTGLDVRVNQATVEAAQNGATISLMVQDRVTQQTVSNGAGTALAIASVAKLFIADDLLAQATPLSADDRQALDGMLRSSDDGAAEQFWNRDGGGDIVSRVAARYGLTSTAPPPDGRWWNTISTAADLVRYYDRLLDGTGGLPPDAASFIINNLSQSTPQGIDGYPQRFGIPDGLYAEPVAVKQGWMCCIGSDWMHLSTGVIGVDHRYVIVIGSQQTSDDATARSTITQAVKTMFPGGHI
jgi:hypothetical protein